MPRAAPAPRAGPGTPGCSARPVSLRRAPLGMHASPRPFKGLSGVAPPGRAGPLRVMQRGRAVSPLRAAHGAKRGAGCVRRGRYPQLSTCWRRGRLCVSGRGGAGRWAPSGCSDGAEKRAGQTGVVRRTQRHGDGAGPSGAVRSPGRSVGSRAVPRRAARELSVRERCARAAVRAGTCFEVVRFGG